MAGFDRRFLMEHGLPEREVEAVLEEFRLAVDEALAQSVPKEEAQQRVDEALAGQEASAGSEAYRKLLEERDMLRAIASEEFSEVKPKFREQVFGMLERGRGAAPVAVQLAALRERYEELFENEAVSEPRQPRLGGPVRGSMPRGSLGPDAEFTRVWGFGRK